MFFFKCDILSQEDKLKFKIIICLFIACILLVNTTSAYQLTDSNGKYYKWNKNYNDPIYVDSSSLTNSWQTATSNAISMWSTSSNDADIRLINQRGRIECAMSAVPITDRNVLAFVNYSTYTYYSSNNTFVVTSTLIRINSSVTNWHTGTGTSSGNYSLQTVIAHELGHVLGLMDNDSYSNGLMRSSLGTGVVRAVGGDEINGSRAIYGRR